MYFFSLDFVLKSSFSPRCLLTRLHFLIFLLLLTSCFILVLICVVMSLLPPSRPHWLVSPVCCYPGVSALLSCLHLATLYFGQLKASGVGDAIKHVHTGSDGQRCRDQRPAPSFSLLLSQHPPLSSSSPPPAWWLHLHPPPPPSVHMSCPSDGLVSDLVPNAT